MYNSEYMYAIERSDEYLAHYGVRGMKWGVRKALAKGGAAGARALSKQYAKAQKKLAKLEKQAGKSKKYARRAALMGVGAAAAGGLAARGTKVVSDTLGGVNRAANALGRGMSEGSQAAQKFLARRGLGGKSIKLTGAMLRSGNALQRATSKGGSMTTSLGKIAGDVNRWGASNSIGQAAKVAGRKFQNSNGALVAKVTGGKGIVRTTDKLGNISNNTIARIGAGAVGAGLAVGAARNAYKAATAKKKAEKFRSEMNKAFAGTQYANGGNRQGGKKKRRR